MTRTLLVVAACLLVSSPAWAIINAPIQEGGGNDVNSVFKSAPATPPTSAAAPVAQPNVSQAPVAPFTPGAYGDAADCMTAASAAHQPLGPCEGLRKK